MYNIYLIILFNHHVTFKYFCVNFIEEFIAYTFRWLTRFPSTVWKGSWILSQNGLVFCDHRHDLICLALLWLQFLKALHCQVAANIYKFFTSCPLPEYFISSLYFEQSVMFFTVKTFRKVSSPPSITSLLRTMTCFF